MDVDQNLRNVRGRIRVAAERAGRDPDAARLIGVVKGVPSATLRQAIDCGLTDLAENFVQEAQSHRYELEGLPATWHFIGHLQTNKASEAIKLFDIIQSIDSLRLGQALNRRLSSPMRVLLEVNVAQESSKFGFLAAEVAEAIKALSSLSNLEVAGLMTVAPAADDPEQCRPVFAELAALARAQGLSELSMGMTNDFEVAIEEGATMVRIGRALFGERV